MIPDILDGLNNACVFKQKRILFCDEKLSIRSERDLYNSEDMNRNGSSRVQRWLIKISCHQGVKMGPIGADCF